MFDYPSQHSDDGYLLPISNNLDDPTLEALASVRLENYMRFMAYANEPSLLAMKEIPEDHVYRFVWSSVSKGPILIRLTIQSNGTAAAVIKRWQRTLIPDGSERQRNYKLLLTTNRQKRIGRRKVNRVFKQLEEMSFWQFTASDQYHLTNGEAWDFEGVKSGQHHSVTGHFPRENKALTDVGLLLLRICGVRDWAVEIGSDSINGSWKVRLEDFTLRSIARLLMWSGYKFK